MFIKQIENNWNFGEIPIQAFHRSTPGLVKQAKWYATYESSPEHTLVLAIFLGSGEYWGCNRNGDYFAEDDLVRCHDTFRDKAKYFKLHKNDDPERNYGDVLETYYNPEMKRVEGIIRIINSRAPETVNRIMGGQSVPLSMACKIKYDVCSICGNKAPSITKYCDHLKYKMCKILDDGKKVYAINPNPIFFDISEVVKGADPTAFTLKKVAQEKDVDILRTSVYNYLSKESYLSKLSVLERLATIEKQIVGLLQKADPGMKILAKGLPTANKGTSVPIGETDDVVGALSKSGIALSPRDFTQDNRIFGGDRVYNFILKNADKIELIPDSGTILTSPLYDTYQENRSLIHKYASYRMTSGNGSEVCLNKVPMGEPIHPAVIKSAVYNLAAICNSPRLLEDPLYAKLLILQNCRS